MYIRIWSYLKNLGGNIRVYGMLRLNTFSYPDIADTRLQETPNAEYPQ